VYWRRRDQHPEEDTMRALHHRRFTPIALATLTLLVACSDDPPPPEATRLSGIAATGAPMAGATITVVDGDATTADPAPVTAGPDGRYTVDVSALKGPLVVNASGRVDGEPVSLVAVVPAATAEVDNAANITPLTNAVAALVAPGGDPQALRTAATLASAVTSRKVDDATLLLLNTLRSDAGIASALGTGFSPLSTPFAADGTGIDAVLDKLAIEVTPAGVAITSLAAPSTDSGVPASVTLTPAMTTTPASAPALPASLPTGELPSVAELAALGKKFEDCLALPVASRVTLDATGTATAVLGICNYAPADWRSNGRNWVEELGQFTFAREQFTGSKIGRATIALTLAPARHTDPKVFKHPYCNDAPCVIARYPMTLPGGRLTQSDWVLAKVGSAWNIVGNQRPYRTFVEARLQRKIGINRDGAAAGSTIDPYFLTDRFESALRLTFDLRHGDTAGIRAVRFTGPGLPAEGVVQFRSQRCGTDDRMGIAYQNGSTRVWNAPASFQFWTGGATTDFLLDAARLDGTPLAMPVPVNNGSTTLAFQEFSPAPVAGLATVVPAWSVYKVEIFRFDTLSDTPDEVVYVRTGPAGENASAGTSKPWPTLAASFVDAYLKPLAASSGALSTLAHSMSFTIPDTAYVTSGYVFGQDFLTTTNAAGERASFGYRARLDLLPTRYGDLTMSGSELVGGPSGTSLSASTRNSGTNPNPRCTGNSVPALTDNTNDYREVGLGFRGADRRFYNAIWFWDN
jgi:hypothetical protein